MGIRVLTSRLLSAVCMFIIAFSQAAFAEEANRLPAEKCRKYMKSLLDDLDSGDEALPYVARQLEEVYGVLNAPHSTTQAFVQAIVDEDIRRAAYRLGALSKALKNVDETSYQNLGDQFKTLEKAIGDYVFETEMMAVVREDETLKKFMTPKIEAVFIGRTVSQRNAMLTSFRRHKWIGENEAYLRILKTVSETDGITKKSKLKEEVLDRLSKRLRKIHAALMDGTLNPNEIEDGIHELRRQIRVIPMMMTAFDGMFKLDKKLTIKGVEARTEAVMKWLDLTGKDAVKNPVPISRDGYYALVALVKDLGKLKAGDGTKEFVVKTIQEAAEFDPSILKEAEPLLDAIENSTASVESFKKTREEAKRIFDDIVATKFLLKMADQIDEERALL